MNRDGRVADERSPATEKGLEYRNSLQPSPKVLLAARLYGSGAVKTKKEAAAAAGIAHQYFSQLSGPNGSPAVKKVIAGIGDAIEDRAVNMSEIMRQLGRESIGTINDIRKGSESEMMVFKAAQDLADRSPEVSKTQKHSVAALTLEGKDVLALQEALLEGSRIAEEYADVAQSGYVGVELEMKEVPTQFKHLSMGEEGNERYATDQEEGSGTESFGWTGEADDSGEASSAAEEADDSSEGAATEGL
jgi:hypothetical protein